MFTRLIKSFYGRIVSMQEMASKSKYCFLSHSAMFVQHELSMWRAVRLSVRHKSVPREDKMPIGSFTGFYQ